MSSEDLQAEARRLESRIRELVQPSSSLLLGTSKPKAQVRIELNQSITRFLHVTPEDSLVAQRKVDGWKHEACKVDPTLRPDDFVPDSNDGLDSREGSAGSSRRSSMSGDVSEPNFPEDDSLGLGNRMPGPFQHKESYIRFRPGDPKLDLPTNTIRAPGYCHKS